MWNFRSDDQAGWEDWRRTAVEPETLYIGWASSSGPKRDLTTASDEKLPSHPEPSEAVWLYRAKNRSDAMFAWYARNRWGNYTPAMAGE